MHDIIGTLDELLLLCEGAAAEALDPEVVKGMRRAIALIQQARTVLQAEDLALQCSPSECRSIQLG